MKKAIILFAVLLLVFSVFVAAQEEELPEEELPEEELPEEELPEEPELPEEELPEEEAPEEEEVELPEEEVPEEEVPEEEEEEIEIEKAEREAGTTPDSILHGLDRAFERISLALTFDRAKKAEKRLKIASERIAELRTMVERGKPEFVEQLSKAYDKELDEAENDIEEAKAKGKNITEVSQRVAEATYKHVLVLERVLEKVPEQAKPHIQNAIEKSMTGNEKAVASIERETGKPADVPKVTRRPERGRPAPGQ